MRTESEWRSWMIGIALKKLGNSADAEDLTQVALLRFWESQGCLPWEHPDSEFAKAACYRLIGLSACEFQRMQFRRGLTCSLEVLPDCSCGYNPVSEYLENAHARNLIQKLTTLLSPTQQEVLIFLAEGYSHYEISKALDIHIGTVKRHILRIRQKASRLMSTEKASANELIGKEEIEMISRIRISVALVASIVSWYTVAHGQQPAQSWFLDKRTEQAVRFELPFSLNALSVEQSQSETRFILSLSNLRQPAGLPEDSVFVLEIHTHDLVIVYTHNAAIVPGVSEDGKVLVLQRKGAVLQAEGRIQFDWNRSQIVVSIPANIPIQNLWGAVYRYLPSTSDMQRVAGGRPPIADQILLTDNPFARRYPGWPYRQNQNRLQQQRRQPNNTQGQSHQQSRGQQRANPGGVSSPGQPVEWRPGDFVDVPMGSPDASHLADDPRFRGGSNRPWDRDISIPSGETVENEPGVKLPGNKIINWGFEHGPFPFPGADRSDAIVGVEGTDRNNNGRLDPDEVEGVVGLCPPDGSLNSFYVDEEGYVHWENRKKGNENNERPDTHYIYDPSRDILKIYDSNGNLIYMGSPQNWGSYVR